MGLRSCDIAVIGGGVIGLATAMRLVQEHPRYSVAVLEKESQIARHQTGHNSGVIHAGIYYSPGSRKANFCASGAKLLRRFCDEHDIPYEMCGKVIVAVRDSQVARLEELYRRGEANGAQGLELIGRERLRELEPHAAGVRAVHSPNTGIIDYTKVSQAYAREVQESGGELHTDTAVLGISPANGGLRLHTAKGDLPARHVINCGGLHADRVARMMGADTGVRIIPFRGEYFSIRPERADLVNGLIYPVPDPSLPFLGVHFSRRISGEVEAGPNAVLAFAREGYRKTDASLRDMADAMGFMGFWRMSKAHWVTGLKEQYRSLNKRAFVRSLQTLVPEIRSEDLHEPGAGIRAQAVDRRGNLLQDFSIAESPNAIHVLNAPSPGATASLSISRHIVDLARRSFGLAS